MPESDLWMLHVHTHAPTLAHTHICKKVAQISPHEYRPEKAPGGRNAGFPLLLQNLIIKCKYWDRINTHMQTEK